MAYNAYWTNLTFTLPTAPNGKCWWLLADTADWAEGTGNVYYDPAVSVWNSQACRRSTARPTACRRARPWCSLARSCTATEAVRVDFTVNNYVTSPGQDLYVVGQRPRAGQLGRDEGGEAQLGGQRHLERPGLLLDQQGRRRSSTSTSCARAARRPGRTARTGPTPCRPAGRRAATKTGSSEAPESALGRGSPARVASRFLSSSRSRAASWSTAARTAPARPALPAADQVDERAQGVRKPGEPERRAGSPERMGHPLDGSVVPLRHRLPQGPELQLQVDQEALHQPDRLLRIEAPQLVDHREGRGLRLLRSLRRRPAARWRASASAARSIGLLRYSSMPAARQRSRSSRMALAVSATIRGRFSGGPARHDPARRPPGRRARAS